MIKILNTLLGITKLPEIKITEKKMSSFSTDFNWDSQNSFRRAELMERLYDQIFKNSPIIHTPEGTAMDAAVPLKQAFMINTTIPESQMLWYSSQSFIGYQLCSILAQHWLISKACLMPAKDAIRNGYEITSNDGKDIGIEVLNHIKKLDVKYKINKNLIELVQMGRVFGIRIVVPIIESDDPDFYLKPFNLDGVVPGSYKGISQVDPYWITPQFDGEDAGNPASINFYEPTWWRIGGRLIHRSHLIIFRTEEVTDIIKPTYIYGGISIPQKIYERVYAAERTANEAPMLALTKRTNILKTDMSQAVANQGDFEKKMQIWSQLWNNFGIKTIDADEEIQQIDTSLADLDAVIMTQYQIVAAAANVPAVKLLGTSPKGFNTTGEFEEANYHEELESIQTHDLLPLLERHYQLLMKSEICPRFGIDPFDITVSFNPLDAMTAKEQAEVNRLKAETGSILINSGIIDGVEERERIINDKESGYNGLPDLEVQTDPIYA